MTTLDTWELVVPGAHGRCWCDGPEMWAKMFCLIWMDLCNTTEDGEELIRRRVAYAKANKDTAIRFRKSGLPPEKMALVASAFLLARNLEEKYA